MTRFAHNVLLFGCGLLFALLLAEGVTRLVRPFSTVEYRVDPEVGQILVANQEARWVNEDYDEVVITNSAGFHDREHETEKPRDVYRVIVIGDSFIEALSAPIELGFTQQLERQLRREVRDRRVEVINLGVSGVGPAQYLRMLEVKGMAYCPDLVVMSVFPENDFWDSYEPLSGAPTKVFYRLQPDNSLKYVPAQASRVSVKMRPWLRKSAFLNLIRQGLVMTPVEIWLGRLGVLQSPGVAMEQSMDWGVYVADHPDPWPNAYRTTLRIIKASQELSVKAGAQFAVMLVGSVPLVEDRWDEAMESYSEAKAQKWDFDRPFMAITELGQRSGFGVINLAEPFREEFRATKTSRSWPHDGHWNHDGNRLAAELVAGYLLAHRAKYGLPN